ncbi:PIGH [Branchiostoma lanceolatum]|uniref:PIGH protein n=1 Tax=Branchiostoma lanceolatum TaxID=7740 RepID=A0A8J9ZRW3_BRALA|nr:PIGH [Branchiostoma lanceolatum]
MKKTDIRRHFQWVLYVLGGLQPCLLLYYLNFVHVHSESIQAVSSIGVQLTTTYTTGRQQSRYYDMVEIQDVVINEVVTMHSVVFYLVLLIKDPCSGSLRSVIPVFKHSYPKLDYLVRVYNGVQDVLYPTITCEQ